MRRHLTLPQVQNIHDRLVRKALAEGLLRHASRMDSAKVRWILIRAKVAAPTGRIRYAAALSCHILRLRPFGEASPIMAVALLDTYLRMNDMTLVCDKLELKHRFKTVASGNGSVDSLALWLENGRVASV